MLNALNAPNSHNHMIETFLFTSCSTLELERANFTSHKLSSFFVLLSLLIAAHFSNGPLQDRVGSLCVGRTSLI